LFNKHRLLNRMALGMHSELDVPRSQLGLILEALGSGFRMRLGDTFSGPFPPLIAALADALAGPTDNPAGSQGDFISGEPPDFGATLLC
jgi:hypothetical protein